MDRLTSMRVFVQVSERGSFAAAAERMEMSRAMVTKHVMALEQHLGVRLLNRTTRRLSLTEAGRAYLERCNQILTDIDETEQAVGQLNATPRGILRVNAPMSFGMRYVAPIVGDFLQRYQGVEIDLVLNDRFVDLVDEGFDMAIRIGQLGDSALVARRLAPMRLVACAAPHYLDKHGTPRHPHDLQQHNCLTYSYSSRGDMWSFERQGETIGVRVRGRLQSNNGDTLTTAAVAGAGVILQPDFLVVDAVESGQLQVILQDYETPPQDIYAVFPHRRYLSAKVRGFVEFLADAFTELLG